MWLKVNVDNVLFKVIENFNNALFRQALHNE
jgi:hypothetical protein